MIDFPNSPTLNQIYNASNGASYQWNGTLWIAIGTSSALIASDTPPTSPGINQLWFNTTLGALFIWFNDGTSSQWVPANPMPSMPAVTSTLLQTVSIQYSGVQSITGTIPLDNSIPQKTEGVEIMTCTIVPLSTSSRLFIQAMAMLSPINVDWVQLAMFRDAATPAMAAVTQYVDTATAAAMVPLTCVTPSVSLASTVFRFRAGSNGGGTTTFNGTGGIRVLGGVMASGVVIQEVL